ncbi:MAG TPA: alpha/beta hydrolase [Gaiellales bacterium]|nr:alpha/beta hydrolase [Gaiellales bacterium]
MHRQSLVLRGRRVNYLEHGEGPPVVMLHGLLGSPAYLLPLARAVAGTGRRVLLPDLHGHGGSDRLESWSLDAAADDLAAAMALAGAEQPALLGHSLGAPICVHWAARHPVEALVCMSPVGMVPLRLGPARHLVPAAAAVARVAEAAARPLAATPAGRRLVFGWFVGMRRPDAVAPPLGERMIRHAVAAAPALEDYLPKLHGLDLREPSALVACRSLTLWGEDDAHAPNGALLAAALRGEARVLPQCGHMPTLEAPFACRRALDGWL